MSGANISDRVVDAVRMHCISKGYSEGEGVNNFVPHDCVAAYQMAKFLVKGISFDYYIAIAPEGHIYGYFFERVGVDVLSIYADPPPVRRVEAVDDVSKIRDGNVLLIEDDVISGSTLRLVVSSIGKYGPRSLSLYLGHAKCFQNPKNVPPEIAEILIAEECLDPHKRHRHEMEFRLFFERLFRRSSADEPGEAATPEKPKGRG